MNGRKAYVAPLLEDLGDLGSFVRASFEGGPNDGVEIMVGTMTVILDASV